MLTEKDYCDYSLLLSLVEIGYPKHRVLDGGFKILLYEAQKWLRKEKKIEVNATSVFIPEHHWFWFHKNLINGNNDVSHTHYGSYEDALSEGIKEAVKILKEK